LPSKFDKPNPKPLLFYDLKNILKKKTFEEFVAPILFYYFHFHKILHPKKKKKKKALVASDE
jgi:hypothetical protein